MFQINNLSIFVGPRFPILKLAQFVVLSVFFEMPFELVSLLLQMLWHILVHIFEELFDWWEFCTWSIFESVPDLRQSLLSDIFLETFINYFIVNQEGLKAGNWISNLLQVVLPLFHFFFVSVVCWGITGWMIAATIWHSLNECWLLVFQNQFACLLRGNTNRKDVISVHPDCRNAIWCATWRDAITCILIVDRRGNCIAVVATDE